MKIQAPVSLQAHILVIDAEGKRGVMQFMFPFGQYPSEQEMRDVVAGALQHPQIPAGARLATKREFLEYVASEMAGHDVKIADGAMPGGEEFDN